MQLVNVPNPNSPDNTDLKAIYDKKDLENLQEPGYRLDLGPDLGSVPIRIFLYGDYEYLTKNFGHLGCCSRYPCLWYYVKLENLHKANGEEHCPMRKNENGEWVERDGWPKRLTIDDMVRDLVDNLFDERNDNNMKTNGSLYHHCIYQPPVLPITTSIEHIVPPVLHIMLGLVQRFFSFLERVCQRIDRGSLDERDPELNDRWEAASIKVQEQEFEVEDEIAVLDVEENFLKCFNSSAQGRPVVEALDNVECALPACAFAHGNPYNERLR